MGGMKLQLGDVPLLDWSSGPQKANFERVYSAIQGEIKTFFNARTIGAHFQMTDLLNAVRLAHPGIAPDSPGRIMRAMRRSGDINYCVVSRAASLYRIEPTRETPS